MWCILNQSIFLYAPDRNQWRSFQFSICIQFFSKLISVFDQKDLKKEYSKIAWMILNIKIDFEE